MKNAKLLKELQDKPYDYSAEENHLTGFCRFWRGWFGIHDRAKSTSEWDEIIGEYANWGDLWGWFGDDAYLPAALFFEHGVVLACTKEQVATLETWLDEHHGILCASDTEFNAHGRKILGNGNVNISQINSLFILEK